MLKISWTDLPVEIWCYIVNYVGPETWRNLSLVNKCFRNIVLQQEKLSKRTVTIQWPKKLSRRVWNRLRSRPVLNLNLEKCSHTNLALVAGKLANISSLAVHLDNLTESTLKCLTSSKSLPTLNHLDLSFSNAQESSLSPLAVLSAKLLKISLKGSFVGSCQGFLQPLCELNKVESLSLSLQWSKTGLEWDKARVVARKAGEVVQKMACLKHLVYRFEAHSNYESLLLACDTTTLIRLETLHLEKAIFNSAPTRLHHMSSLESLTLVDCLSMISHHSNFFEGMTSLRALTLRHVEDSPNILSHLPPTLRKISLRSMTSTKAFSMYLKKHGDNIEHLELDGVFEINCMLVESFPNILPNLKTFHYRHNYYEVGTVMSFLRFKKLVELDMTGCTSHENVDTAQLKQIVKDRMDNRVIFTI